MLTENLIVWNRARAKTSKTLGHSSHQGRQIAFKLWLPPGSPVRQRTRESDMSGSSLLTGYKLEITAGTHVPSAACLWEPPLWQASFICQRWCERNMLCPWTITPQGERRNSVMTLWSSERCAKFSHKVMCLIRHEGDSRKVFKKSVF